MSVASDPAGWPLHSATIMIPSGITAADLGQAPHIRQCSVYCRARSRAAFARRLIEVGIESRSPAAVAAWAREWSTPSTGGDAARLVTDDRVWLGALDHHSGDRQLVPYDRSARMTA